jgi:long-chain fatty acid transport protein
VGGTLVSPRGFFQDNATSLETDLEKLNIPVPNFYYAQNLGERAAIGLGVFVPYGLETKWPTTFAGRFIGYNAAVQGAYVQPTLAFRASDQFMIGGGVDIAYYKLRLRQRVDLSTQAISGTPLTFGQIGVPRYTDFADIMLEGHDIAVGFHVGALIKPSEKFSIGARYISKVKISTTEGDITTEQIPTGFRLPIPLGPTVPAGTPVDAILQGQFQSGQRLSSQKADTSSWRVSPSGRPSACWWPSTTSSRAGASSTCWTSRARRGSIPSSTRTTRTPTACARASSSARTTT